MDTLNKNNILRSVYWPALSNENEEMADNKKQIPSSLM